MRDLRSALVCSFNQLLDLRDLNTGVHSTRLAEWAVRVARDLGVPEKYMPDLEMGALLHDIGKIGVPDGILNKPNRLTDKEYEIVKRHPEFGWTVIRNLPGLEQTSLYVLHHHEISTGLPIRPACEAQKPRLARGSYRSSTHSTRWFRPAHTELACPSKKRSNACTNPAARNSILTS
jgi:HD domain